MTDQQWRDEALRLAPILEGAADSDKEPRRLYLYEVEALRRAAAHLRTRPSAPEDKSSETEDERCITYTHCTGGVRFRQPISAPLPSWAYDVRPDEPSAEPLPVAQGEREERARIAFELRQAMIDYGSAVRSEDHDRVREVTQRGCTLIEEVAARATAPKLRELSDGEIQSLAGEHGTAVFVTGWYEFGPNDLREFARAVLAAAGKEKP